MPMTMSALVSAIDAFFTSGKTLSFTNDWSLNMSREDTLQLDNTRVFVNGSMFLHKNLRGQLMLVWDWKLGCEWFKRSKVYRVRWERSRERKWSRFYAVTDFVQLLIRNFLSWSHGP
jgi:hypothetical protein